MRVGLMWFDDSGAPLEEKLVAIKQRAFIRLGYTPDTCRVGPDMIEESGVMIDGVCFIKDKTVPHNYFWMGDEDA